MKLKDIKAKLPTTVDIADRDEYFNSAVLLLLTEIKGELHIIFEKRASQIPQGGEICLPGGKAEPLETRQETAIRETVEELGIPEKEIEIIGQLNTVIAPLGVIVDAFVGYTTFSIEKMQKNNDEVERIFSVPVRYFAETVPEMYKVMIKVHPTYFDEKTQEEVILLPYEELGVPEKYGHPWGRLSNKIYVFKTKGEVIWGITARIIVDFVKNLSK